MRTLDISFGRYYRRPMRWDRLLRCGSPLFIAIVASATSPLRATVVPEPPQRAPGSATCGWSFIQPRDVPPTLQSLRNRATEVPEWMAEAESHLLRWYRTCDETAGRMAVQTLQVLRRRTNSSDPILLAWLGIALVRGPEVQVPHAEGTFLRATHKFSNSERDGTRLLAQVTELTGWSEIADELAATAVATRKDETLRLASRALWSAVETRAEPAVWSTLAEVELVRGDSGAAARASMRAVSAGSPRGMRVVGILRMLAGNDASGAEPYLDGLALASEESDVNVYFDDLRLLLTDDEMADWQSIEIGRTEWIRRKWEWRAQMAGVRLAERLGVNQRRMHEAMRRYDRQSFRGASDPNAMWKYDTGNWRMPLDDRGMIFLRHGAPHVAIEDRIGEGGGRGGAIAWVFGGPASRPMTLQFKRPFGRPDYWLIEPPPCFPEAGADDVRRKPRPPSDYALSLATHDPQLGWYYIRCQWNPETGIFDYHDARTAARQSAEIAWNSESGIVHFDQPLKTAWNLYAFHTRAGPELVSYLAVEGAGLASAEAANTRVDLGVLLSVGDPVTEAFTQIDTILSYASATPLPRDAVLQWALPIRTPTSSGAHVTLTVRNQVRPTQGRTASTTWGVVAFDGALLLSDIVIAEARTGILRRGSHAIAPALGHAVFEDTPFRLYHELYGAEADDPLAITIQIAPAKDASLLARLASLISSRNALLVEFEDRAQLDPDGIARFERELRADLEPGAYSVVVTVRNERTGETVSKDTNLVVRD